MSLLSPPPDQVSRFRKDLEELTPHAFPLGLAVSGGPDSLALLLLAQAAFPGRIEAATVDHGLRPESILEALHVEDICDRIGCPHAILSISVPDGPAGVQGEARAARYNALSGWAKNRGLAALATAHHADDQAETLLMRLQRGSGVAGLAGIRPVRRMNGLLLLRPLLHWSKADLVHLVAGMGIEAMQDASNSDTRFERVAMRRFLESNSQFQAQRLARTAAAMQQAEEALEWAAEQAWRERVSGEAEGQLTLTPAGLPPELLRRLLVRILVQLHPAGPPPRGEDIQRLASALASRAASTLRGVKCKGGDIWNFSLEGARRGKQFQDS